MMAKIIFVFYFIFCVVLYMQCTAAEDNTAELSSATTPININTETQPKVLPSTTTTTTTSPNEPTSTVITTEAIKNLATVITTLKPKTRKTHKKRKTSKAAIKKYTELLDFTIGEVMNIADLTINITKQMFKDVIVDVSQHHEDDDVDQSNLMNEKILILSAFITKADEVQRTNDTLGKLGLVEELDGIMEQFNQTAACTSFQFEVDDHACAVNALFQSAFQQHNFNSLEKQIEQRNLLFLENFNNAANKFWNSLTPKDQKKGHLFNEWLMEFQSAQDSDRKFDLLWMWFDDI